MMNELLRQFTDAEEFGSQDFTGCEFETYYNLSKFLNPKSVLEIGVYKGHSACSIIHGAKELEVYYGIDSEAYIENSNSIAKYNIENFCLQFGRKEVAFSVVNHDTQIYGIPDNMKGKMFDWIHIDAGHTTKEAIKDVLTFWPMAGKCLTVHDYLSHAEVKEAVDVVVRENKIDFKNQFCIHSLHGFATFFK